MTKKGAVAARTAAVKRRTFTREFKLKVIREVEAGKSQAQVAREYQITENTISKWLASGEAGDEGGRIFFWEAASNDKPRSLALRSGVEAINFSPDANTLAAGTEDGKILLVRFQLLKSAALNSYPR